MKKVMIMTALLLSTSLLLTPFSIIAEETESTMTEESTQPLVFGSYEGYFDGLIGAPSHVYVGDMLDPSLWSMSLYCQRPNDTPVQITLLENYLEADGIPVSAEEYAHCYTIDTSEVDLTKPGNYQVYVKTLPGESAVFHYRGDTNYRYEVTMQEHTYKYEVCVMPIPSPEISLLLKDSVIFDNEETCLYFTGTVSADLTGWKVNAEPEGIVEIGEFTPTDPDFPRSIETPTATIKALKPGEVIIKASTDSGLTSSYSLTVRDHTHYLDGFTVDEGQTWTAVFYSESGQKATFSVADDSIARIINVDSESRENTQLVSIQMLRPGSTTLTAVTPDGRTETAVINALSTETTLIATDTDDHMNVKQLGDVNGGGMIDLLDVIYLNKYLLGVLVPYNFDKSVADVDCNGKVDTTDSLLILKRALHVIDRF